MAINEPRPLGEHLDLHTKQDAGLYMFGQMMRARRSERKWRWIAVASFIAGWMLSMAVHAGWLSR